MSLGQRRGLWVVLFFSFIMNQGACEFIMRTRCNPLVIASCEP